MSDPTWGAAPPPGGGSIAPGEPPPGGPPPPPPLPWEDRQRLGLFTALIETIKLMVSSPGEAYRRAREKGDYFAPLLFAVIVGWVMAVVSQIWSALFQSAWIGMLPSEFRQQFGQMMATSVVAFVVAVVVAPIILTIVLFIWSGIVHLFLSLVGGTSGSAAGFEGTFRAIAYAQVASVAQAVPVVGGLIAAVWGIVLQVIGLATLHRTTTGKAAAAVLIPIGLCCVCIAAIVVIAGASLLTMLGTAAQH